MREDGAAHDVQDGTVLRHLQGLPARPSMRAGVPGAVESEEQALLSSRVETEAPPHGGASFFVHVHLPGGGRAASSSATSNSMPASSQTGPGLGTARALAAAPFAASAWPSWCSAR